MSVEMAGFRSVNFVCVLLVVVEGLIDIGEVWASWIRKILFIKKGKFFKL